MAVKGLEQTRSRLDQVKRFGGLVVVAILVAALVVGVLIIAGLFNFVPAPQVFFFGFVVPPTLTAFIGAFTLAMTLIVSYVYFAQLVRSALRKAWKFWLDLPTRAQAIILGLEAGIVALLSVYITHVLVVSFGLVTMLATFGATWVVVVAVTLRVHGAGWTITEWGRTLHLSALFAAVVAVLSGFAFAGVAPGYTPPVVFLVGWAVCAYLLFRRRHAIEDSFVTGLLTRTGYAQMRRIETVSVSLGTGLAVALIVAIVVGLAGTAPSGTLRRAGLSIALVWPVVTFATSVGWPDAERSDLVIDDINVRSSTEVRELTLRNIGDRPVNLRNAKVIDAYNELYHVGVDTTLGAGSRAKFEIPEEFELATHERYELFGLPFGFVVMREATDPEVVTRDGRAYGLRWIDQVRDAG